MTKNRFLSFFYGEKALIFYWAVVFVVSFLILFNHSVGYLDPDFGWHLRVGKDIELTGGALTIETYTYPTLGEHWVDHEWLSNYLLFKIYTSGKFGYWILGAIFSSLVTLTFLISVLATRKVALPKTNPWNFFFFGSPLLLAGTFILLYSFGIRLQVLSWFLTILLCCIFAWVHLYKKTWALWFTPLIMLLWANLHGTFFFGLFFFAIFVLFVLLATKKKWKMKLLYIFSLLLSVLATFVTPYNVKLWELVLEEYTQNRGYLMQIQEWFPMYAVPYINWWASAFLGFFITLFTIGVLAKVLPKDKNLIFYVLFVFGLLAISVKSRRFLPLFIFSSYPLILFLLVKVFPGVVVKKWICFLSTLVFLMIIPFQLKRLNTVPLNPFEQNTDVSPHQALQFIKNHPELENLNIYNQYEWGGYLDWVWPEKKLFIDGRMPQKPLANGNTFLEEYFSLRKKETIQEKFKEYNIEMVLVPNESRKVEMNLAERYLVKKFFMFNMTEFNKEEDIYPYLREHWDKIYSDDIAAVFVHPSVTKPE